MQIKSKILDAMAGLKLFPEWIFTEWSLTTSITDDDGIRVQSDMIMRLISRILRQIIARVGRRDIVLDGRTDTGNITTDIRHIIHIRTLLGSGRITEKIADTMERMTQTLHLLVRERMVLTCLDKSLMVRTMGIIKDKDIGGQLGGTKWNLNSPHPYFTSTHINEDTIGLIHGIVACKEIEELLIETMVVEEVLSPFGTMVFGFGDESLVEVQETTHLVEHSVGLILEADSEEIGIVEVLGSNRGRHMGEANIHEQRGLDIVELAMTTHMGDIVACISDSGERCEAFVECVEHVVGQAGVHITNDITEILAIHIAKR